MRTMLTTLALASSLPLVAQTQTLTTVFGPGTYISAPATLYFDIDVTNPLGVVVSGVDLNSNATAGTPGNLAFYLTPTTYVGNETNATAWTQLTTGTVTTRGSNNPATVNLGAMFYLPFGTYGVAIHHIDFNPLYTNPTSVTPNLPLVFGDGNLSLTFGRSRACLANDPFGGTSAGSSPRIANLNLRYVVGTLACDFTADVVGGNSPLQVQFTDRSHSGAAGGITAWAWDFDGDGIVDSTLASPSHVFPCGDHDVSLTVTDANGVQSQVRAGYIRTDVVTPAFSVAPLTANSLQFADACSPAPDTWAWDLDGDGIVDSSAPNPTWTYAASYTEATVTLTVTKACQTYTLTKRVVAAKTLETRFDGGTVTTSTATGGANLVNLTVLNPVGISVGGLWVHSNVATGSPVGVNVYAKAGVYAGSEAIAADWRLLASASATSLGLGQRTYVALSPPIYFAAGNYGLCIEQVGHSPVYINAGGTQTFGNADLSLTAGATQGEPVLGAGTLYTPRIWNGALHYTTFDLVPQAGYGFFDVGCPGVLGVPGNVAQSLPQTGATMTVALSNLPMDTAFFTLGWSRTSSTAGPLPLDLTAFGAPACWLRSSVDMRQLVLGSGTAATYSLALPNLPVLLGAQLFSQAFVLDLNANGLGVVMSDAAVLLIGS